MDVRIIFLAATLITITAPLRAEEVQLTFTGGACPLNGACSQSQPFSVSFDLNTLSGTRTPTFIPVAGVSCLEIFEAQGISMTNFAASVGGKGIQAPRSGRAQASTALFQGASCQGPGYQLFLSTPNAGFTFETSITPSLTQAQYQASKDPLLLLLEEGFPGNGVTAGLTNFNLDVTNTTIREIGVPEPDAAALFLVGLFGVGLIRLTHRRRPGLASTAGRVGTPLGRV